LIPSVFKPIPVAVRSNSSVCGRSVAGIAGSNPSVGVYICLLFVVYCAGVEATAKDRSLVQRSPSDSVCVREREIKRNSSPLHLQWENKRGQTTNIKILSNFVLCGPGSSVGITTDYRLDGPRIESRWGRDFSHTSRPALGPTQPPAEWVPGLSRE
jgi:hypothetical protein